MCYAVNCGSCGNATWKGCGKHVESVFKSVPAGKHCFCNPWPGVLLPDMGKGPAPMEQKETISEAKSACASEKVPVSTET
ncbi:hypothetical protein O6H91_09G097600 [Diphasiastrum complanatum]|uniref:Uncharacterized protein n=1 Tax=Diphasiastrum complanatum TaxID=34168 RepID=A0ACC2CS79_DIPCM|nr:hypothetical protein O6H91_09G097600 [Diphasiastrum complanatum]